MSACQFFGYTKSCLLSRNIKALIPDIIAKNHNKALLNAEKKDLSYFNKLRDFFSYGRLTTGYISPLTLNVRKVLSFSLEGDQYAALINPIQYSIKSDEMHMLIDTKLRITDITETCFRFLGIKKDILKKQKIKIHTIVPDFPTQKKLEEELNGAEEKRNQQQFIESIMDIYIPSITECGKEDIKGKFRSDNNDKSREDDDSSLSALRKNEIQAEDSFYITGSYEAQENIEEGNEDEEICVIEIDPKRKMTCKVGIMPVYIEGVVGYAIRMFIVNNKDNNSVAILNKEMGKYQMEFHVRGNCFIRVPTSKIVNGENDV